MRPDSMEPLSLAQATSTGNANVATIAVPKGTSAVILSADTNPARVTLDGTAPTATVGHVIQNTLQPVLLPVASATIQFVSNAAAAASTLTATFLS